MKKTKEGWKELEDGGRIISAGNSTLYKTGDWRTNRPVWDQSKCTQCMICWIACPDSSIPAKDKKRAETDFDHCKGCGICAEICPTKCIKMKPETEFQ